MRYLTLIGLLTATLLVGCGGYKAGQHIQDCRKAIPDKATIGGDVTVDCGNDTTIQQPTTVYKEVPVGLPNKIVIPPEGTYNKFDKWGNKTGLWVEEYEPPSHTVLAKGHYEWGWAEGFWTEQYVDGSLGVGWVKGSLRHGVWHILIPGIAKTWITFKKDKIKGPWKQKYLSDYYSPTWKRTNLKGTICNGKRNDHEVYGMTGWRVCTLPSGEQLPKEVVKQGVLVSR